jgi:uncharacterized membrane protein
LALFDLLLFLVWMHLPRYRFLPLAHLVVVFFETVFAAGAVTGAETGASGAWVRLPGATGPGPLLNVP